MFAASYLQLSRHNVYYFRIAIPIALRAHFPRHQREIKQSLRTCDRAIAFPRARLLHVKIDHLFSQLQGLAMSIKHPSVPMTFDVELNPTTGRLVKVTDIRPGEEDAVNKVVAALAGHSWATSTATVAFESEKGSHVLADAILSDVVEKYLAHYKPSVSISTFERRRGHLGIFVEYFNNCKISTIGRAKLSDFWDDLAFIPPQKDIRPDFKDQKIKSVVEKQKKLAQENLPYKGLAKQTQDHYRAAVSGFYNWCVEKEIVDENVAARKTKRAQSYVKEMENEPRDLYTIEDLKRIFEHDFFVQGQYKHPYQYWIAHIALFTGARINEIAQLYVDDIQQYDGVWAIEFCRTINHFDKGGTPVIRTDVHGKNKASHRLTPIHAQLIDLGLLTFCDSVRAAGHPRLFPELPYSKKGGYGTRASRWYMEEFLRPKVGITNPAKVFHSFRHTVITELGNTLFEMPEGKMVQDKDLLIKAIVGHTMEDITFGHYMKQFHPKTTSKVLSPLAWDVALTPYVPIMRAHTPVKRKATRSPLEMIKEKIASTTSIDTAPAHPEITYRQLPPDFV